MDQYDREKLEYGRNLRESSDLIECRAIVEFDDGSNWQWVYADIPPSAINDDGYVEEVWIAPETMSIGEQDINGEVHLILSPGWLVDLNIARIDRIEVDEQKPKLLPSPNLRVKYRMSPRGKDSLKS